MTDRTAGIGIDLGTSNSAVCRVDTSTGAYEFAHAMDTAGNRDIASAVFLDTDQRWHFGQTAVLRQQSPSEAARVIGNFKLLLRDNAPLEIEGVGSVDPVDLTRAFVGYLKQCYESHFKEPCTRAVVTVPANAEFDADYLERINQALKDGPNGPLFESIETLPEPDAVLMSLIDLEPLDGRTVLVFDMGGGTLDVTIRTVEITADRPVLHHAAVLGSEAAGVEVTWALADHLLDMWEVRGGFTLTAEERATARRVNLFAIDSSKRHLSGTTRLQGLATEQAVNVRVNLPGRGDGYFAANIQGRILTDLSRPTCEKAIATVETALKKAGMVASEVDDYFMVGGSSQLPLMEHLLRELFGGRGPSAQMGRYGSIDPLLAVSRGAAVQDLVRPDVHRASANVPRTTPLLERQLPYSVSLVVDSDAVECLVEEGTPLPFGPVSKTLYMPVDDDNIDIIMMRGSGRREDCVPMTHRTVYFDRVVRKNELLQVRWFVSEDGQVTVSILDDDGQPIEAITAERLEPTAA